MDRILHQSDHWPRPELLLSSPKSSDAFAELDCEGRYDTRLLCGTNCSLHLLNWICFGFCWELGADLQPGKCSSALVTMTHGLES